MDPAQIYRQALGTVAPRHYQPPQHYFPQQPPPAPPTTHDDLSDEHNEAPNNRIAHTLTACCRCRQRKTRCDPTLPRCLPCERSGSVCEYLDTAKGRKINRYYVIKLQDKVKALEAELAQYVDEDGDYADSSEDILRPGGMVRLGASDETPRYLGPSSGIAMTRLLMEEAKRYTETNRISDLIPELRARRQARMQSIQMTGPVRTKSYPMLAEHPAEALPTRNVADKLVEIYNQKAQIFYPILHEKQFQKDLDAVYNGDMDVFKLFITRMVFAISLQKLDDQYAGLADSYYLAAMQGVEEVIRSKDLKTLQCLALIGQYSLATPTRTPIYYVIGLASKICQQEGLVAEETITTGYNLDPMTIDMRRRLVWVITSMEFGLAHTLGRPNSFATKNEEIDVKYFATVDDEHITEHGIEAGPPSPRKLAAIHFNQMRTLQAEIRRILYETKRSEPKNDMNPWYQHMEKRMKHWLDTSPENPSWLKSWVHGRYHQMKIFTYRPSPQISKPSPRAAGICFESSEFIIELSRKQMDNGAIDITWIFLQVLNMALTTLLWTVSYAEVRQVHPREKVEDLTDKALEVLDRCAERWPGTESSCHLYTIFSKACLQSYESNGYHAATTLSTPPARNEGTASPESTYLQQPMLEAPQFGYVFDSPPEAMNTYNMDAFPPPHPTFRSNSIFQVPNTTDTHGRRFSYFPPDFTHLDDITAPDDPTPPGTTPEPHFSPPIQIPTPPESIENMSAAASTTLSPPHLSSHHSQPPMPPTMPSYSSPSRINPAQPQISQRMPPYGFPRNTQQHHMAPQQRPLPQAPPGTEWFSPTAPFIPAYNFGHAGGNFYQDPLGAPPNFNDMSAATNFGQHGFPPHNGHQNGLFEDPFGRHGSLSQSQQLELMNVLETEGVHDIDAFLNSGFVPDSRQWQ